MRLPRLTHESRYAEAAAMAAGSAVALGTMYAATLAADALMLALALAIRRRPPWWALAIVAPVALSGAWSWWWWSPPWAALRIVSLAIVLIWALPRARWVAFGLIVALSIQTGIIVMTLDHPRTDGLTQNASVLGQVGLMVLWTVPLLPRLAGGLAVVTVAITLGASLARAPFLAAALSLPALVPWPLRFGWPAGRALAAFAGVVAVGALAMAIADVDRISSIPGALAGRADLLRPDGAAFSWLGYGFDSYVQRVGAIAGPEIVRPHVVPLVAVYELGVLAALPSAALAWGLWTRRLPWRLMPALTALWIFTEEQWGSPGGHYMLAMMIVAAVALEHPHPQGQEAAGDQERAEGGVARSVGQL